MKSKFIKALTLGMVISFSYPVLAVRYQTLSSNPNSFYKSNSAGVMVPLSLSRKKIIFNDLDYSSCARNIKRISGSLVYSCKVPLMNNQSSNILKQMLGNKKTLVKLSKTQKIIHIEIPDNIQYIKFSTEFQKIGLDLDFLKFNKDFFSVYSSIAHRLFVDIMKTENITIDLYESKSTLNNKISQF